MLIRCKHELKERIFENLKNLKDKVNADGKQYYINKQLPEQLIEQNREIRATIREQKIKDSKLQPRDRSNIEVKNKIVYIDGEPTQKLLLPVEIDELFPDKVEAEKQGKMKLSTSDAIVENNSHFQAYVCKTGQLHEVCRAYRKVRHMHPGVTHVVASYNLRGNRGYQDDAEYGTGNKLLKFLEQKYPINLSVFIVRMYGGKHLGPTRFDIMKEAAMQALDRAGIQRIEEQTDST